MALLEIKNIRKNFGDTQVLKGVSFSLQKGQVVAIIGSSGSGKTTLLRCLNFLETPDSGDILVDGKLLSGDNLSDSQIRENRLHFGLVFQNYNLFPQYTALQNVTLAPSLLKKENPAALKQRGLELLDQVGPQGQGTGYVHPLLLAAGKLPGIGTGFFLKPHLIKKIHAGGHKIFFRLFF